MTILIHHDQVPLRVDDQGNIYVGPSRVLLDTIIGYFKQGMTPEDLAGSFDTVSLADVYATLAYYLRHKAELDEYLRLREQECEEQRRKIEVAQPPLRPEIKARMEAFRARRDAGRASSAQ